MTAEDVLAIIVVKFERDIADGYRSSTRDYVLDMAKIVSPIAKPVCPCCKLTDITLARTCHNSSCDMYAKETDVYQGW